jgi:hypothetical protein
MDDKTSAYFETNIAGQDNSATPLLNVRPSQIRSSHSQDGLQMDVGDGKGRDREGERWTECFSFTVQF